MDEGEMPVLVDFVPLVAGFIAYQIVQLLMRICARHLNPSFYADLQAYPKRKFEPYFVFYMGWLLTAVSTPFCISAAVSLPVEADRFGMLRNLSDSEQVCLGSRAILWVSELPGLSFSNEMIIHHVLSLSSMVGVLQLRLPLRQLYCIYSSLSTELLSDVTAILRLHGLTPATSNLMYYIGVSNVLVLLIVRLSASVFSLLIASHAGAPTRVMLLNFGGLSLYAAYLIFLVFRQSVNLGILAYDFATPANIVCFRRYKISVFSMYLGVALAVAQLATLMSYSKAQTSAITTTQLQNLAFAALQASIIGIFGARVVSAVARSGVSLVSYPANCTKRGLWLQGGLLASSSWVVVHPSMGDYISRTTLLAAMGLSLPLGECIGRIGCYFAGCCGNRASTEGEVNRLSKLHGTQIHVTDHRIPVQIQCSLLSLLVFFMSWSAFYLDIISIVEGGLLAIACQGLVRLLIEPLRVDLAQSHLYRGKINITKTGLFASLQILGSIVLSGWYSVQALPEQLQSLDGSLNVSAILPTVERFGFTFSCLVIAALILRRLHITDDNAHRKHSSKRTWFRSKNPSPAALVSAIGILLAILAYTESGRHPTTPRLARDTVKGESQIGNLGILGLMISSPIYIVYTLCTSLAPVMFLQVWDN